MSRGWHQELSHSLADHGSPGEGPGKEESSGSPSLMAMCSYGSLGDHEEAPLWGTAIGYGGGKLACIGQPAQDFGLEGCALKGLRREASASIHTGMSLGSSPLQKNLSFDGEVRVELKPPLFQVQLRLDDGGEKLGQADPGQGSLPKVLVWKDAPKDLRREA